MKNKYQIGLLLLLLPPVKVPLAGEAPEAAHAVRGHHLWLPRVVGVGLVLAQRQRRRHEPPGPRPLQTLVLLPEDSPQRGLQTFLLRGRGCCGGPLLGQQLRRVQRVLGKIREYLNMFQEECQFI